MIINAKKRLTAASSYSWFNSYPPVKWEDKEKNDRNSSGASRKEGRGFYDNR